MSLWQITVSAFLAAIAALMGAVLVYVKALTNRIGTSNATLKRLEDALLTRDFLREQTLAAAPAAAAAAEVTLSPSADMPAPPVAESGVSYLTVRDLKEISRGGRPAGENAVAMFPVSREALNTKARLTLSTTTLSATTLAVDAASVSPEVPGANREQQGFPDGGAVAGTAVAETVVTKERVADELESHEYTVGDLQTGGEVRTSGGVQSSISGHSAPVAANSDASTPNADVLTPTADALAASADALAPSDHPPDPSGEIHGEPASPTENADLIEERRKRDAELIMSAQRRRRRARGY